jgi:hypothetical protein
MQSASAPRGRRPVDTILQHECLADEPPHRSSTNPQLSGDSWLTVTFDIEPPHFAYATCGGRWSLTWFRASPYLCNAGFDTLAHLQIWGGNDTS